MRGSVGWPERCMRCRAAEKAAAADEKKKNKKNLKVLSFGDDVEEDDEDLGPSRAMRSAHDATKDPRCGHSTLFMRELILIEYHHFWRRHHTPYSVHHAALS